MQLLTLNLENFRNIPFASLRFGQNSHFLVGANGQGKTNLLEAIGLVSALRSFRTQDTVHLIRSGAERARLFFTFEHEIEGEATVEIELTATTKKCRLNGENVGRMADFLGIFPTVVLSSEDIQLLRGAPQLRRRLLDMTLSTVDKDYFSALRRYHRALKERNSLLRNGKLDTKLLSSFESIIAPEAWALVNKRAQGLAQLNQRLQQAYQKICELDEQPELVYKANAEFETTEAVLKLLHSQRTRDHLLKATQRGPHRDDVQFRLKGRLARDFASEGQQRGLVVALRMAQVEAFQAVQSIQPIVLADDVLGELDPVRRKGFWAALGEQRQIVATGTVLPSALQARQWKVFVVDQGGFGDGAQ